MKNYLWIFFLIIIIIIGVIFYVFNYNQSTENYTTKKIITENNSNSNINYINRESNENKEEIIAEFSTNLSENFSDRTSNIELACNTINNTVVKAGDTFSFWEIVGNPTKEKGYKKAKTFVNKKIKKTYGGGICQVSTTIYNAVLNKEEFEVIERHEHSNEVSYIEDGKDATVAYNNLDLKFKNKLEYDIIINAKVEHNKVIIKILKS